MSTPAAAAGITDAVDVELSWNHGCARTSAGAAWCWGANDNGQFGNGQIPPAGTYFPPVRVATTGVADIAVGEGYTCLAMTDGTVRCAGTNTSGQLGMGDTTARTTFTTVPSLTGIVAVDAHTSNTCAITSAGAPHCWGRGTLGGAGNGTTANQLTPATVAGMTSGVVDVNQGWQFGCVVKAGPPEVWCWGDNTYGQLGQGTAGSWSGPAVKVPLLGTNPTRLVGSSDGMCVAFVDRHLECWGSNGWNRFGMAGYNNAVIGENGRILTIGQGSYGTMGDGSLVNDRTAATGIVSSIPGTDGKLTVIAQVKLANNPGAGIARNTGTFQAGMTFAWNPVEGRWNLASHFPELE